MKLLVIIDGDLLVKEDPSLGMKGQKEAIVEIVDKLGEMTVNNHKIVIVHGNAPQVGYMLLRGEAARHVIHSLPLDICGADTQAATGYMIQQALLNWLNHKGLKKEITTLITQVEVDDSGFDSAPFTKGIGPYFDWERVQNYKRSRGWEFKMFPGLGYQRIVPGFMPKRIIEANLIKYLVDREVIVICAGGGGIPVRHDKNGDMVGVEAVIDKSYTSVLLAQELNCQKIIFVSPRKRIVSAYGLNLTSGLQTLDLTAINRLIKEAEMPDTMRHKLIASKTFLKQKDTSVIILPPDQLGADFESCCGVRLDENIYLKTDQLD